MPDYSLLSRVFNEGVASTDGNPCIAMSFRKIHGLTCQIILVDDGRVTVLWRSCWEIVKNTIRWKSLNYPKFWTGYALDSRFFPRVAGKNVWLPCRPMTGPPPAIINDMLKALYKEGYEVVICTREAAMNHFIVLPHPVSFTS